MPGEIISERRATSNRNGGRHHRGFAGDFPRNPQYGHNNNNNDLIHRIEKAIPSRRRKGDTGSGEYEPRPIANDGPEANELVQWFFGEANRLLAGGGCCCCCCCGGGGPDPQFARWSLWLDEALGFKQMVVWDKGPMGLGWHYRRSYETVLVGEKRGARCPAPAPCQPAPLGLPPPPCQPPALPRPPPPPCPPPSWSANDGATEHANNTAAAVSVTKSLLMSIVRVLR
jgi:hypothetical protein